MSDYNYVGDELDLFANATRWKSYLRGQIRPYLGRGVLEVGAGFGGTTSFLCKGERDRWVCLEPDRRLATRLEESVAQGQLPACCETVVGAIDDLPAGDLFDSILYIDVLEHIEDDQGEVVKAAARLKPGGHLIVLSPAHPFLFSEFDKAIGHFRRYTKAMIRNLKIEGVELARLRYLDSVGMMASVGNRLLLRQSMPTPAQIAVWDKVMVPASRLVDPVVAHLVGKSVLAIWKKL